MSELKDFSHMFSLDGKVALVTGGRCSSTNTDKPLVNHHRQALEVLAFTQLPLFFLLVQERSSYRHAKLKVTRVLTRP